MKTYVNTKTYCPNCGHILFRGPLKFGPSAVKCKQCKQEISTGLTDWQDLTFFEKSGNILKEIFLPSWFLPRRATFDRGFVHLFFIIFTTISIGPLIPLVEKMPENVFLYLLIVIVMLWYPIFILIPRIIKIRKHSVRYQKRGIMPQW